MWTRNLSTRTLFFTGKGGVGKTSLACATAVSLADQGRRVLLISTDPASNLDEVLDAQLGTRPTEVPGVLNLWAMNLEPEAAAQEYRERVVAPYRGKLPDAVIRNMEEQFSGACTTEIAAFDAFVGLLADAKTTESFDHVVFDTAPTGHTLRLLSLPGAWTGYLNTTTAESSCLGPLAGLQDQRGLYEQAFLRLKNTTETTLVLVARPDVSSLKEAARTSQELRELGIEHQQLIVNGVYEPASTPDALSRGMAESQRAALAQIPQELQALEPEKVPLLGGNTVGLPALRQLLKPQTDSSRVNDAPFRQESTACSDAGLSSLVDQLAAFRHGVIMTMGKGGVGKSSVAARIATELQSRGHRVILATTDPAGDLDSMSETVEVFKIDPQIEVQRYTQAALEKAQDQLDEDALALLKEDLRSPCTEEIAVFRAFADLVALGTDRFVVIDTAPTGHTILLMDATEAYHREVSRTQSDAPPAVRELLPRLRDPNFVHVLLVTLPEPTPVHEAMRLQDDLRRAGIEPFGWVVNRSLGLVGTSEPILAAKAAKEVESIDEVRQLGLPVAILPWTPAPTPALVHAP